MCEMSCGSEVVGGAGGGGATEEEEEEEEKEKEPGVSEQKQKPHTKMWGKKHVMPLSHLGSTKKQF